LQEADKSGRTSWNINAKTRNIKNTINDWVRNKKEWIHNKCSRDCAKHTL
jgi:hypothetical protein